MQDTHHVFDTVLGFLTHPVVILPWIAMLIPGLGILRTPEALIAWLVPAVLVGLGLFVDHTWLHPHRRY